MTSEKIFRTESIDLAACLTASGHDPKILVGPDAKRAIFEFNETEDILTAIVNFEGGFSLPAKKLLNIRSRLYRQASLVVKGGSSK